MLKASDIHIWIVFNTSLAYIWVIADNSRCLNNVCNVRHRSLIRYRHNDTITRWPIEEMGNTWHISTWLNNLLPCIVLSKVIFYSKTSPWDFFEGKFWDNALDENFITVISIMNSYCVLVKSILFKKLVKLPISKLALISNLL